MSRPDRRSGRGRGAPGPRSSIDGGLPSAAFTCVHCGQMISDLAVGTSQRNHCPHCLWSLHVDIKPGDRRSLCKAPMEPIAIWVLDDGEWRLIHRCTACGMLKANRIAGDDSEKSVRALATRLDGGPGF